MFCCLPACLLASLVVCFWLVGGFCVFWSWCCAHMCVSASEMDTAGKLEERDREIAFTYIFREKGRHRKLVMRLRQ